MKQKTILVVDDEPNFLVYLHRLLGDHYRVHGVTSAREGLEQVKTLSPDLILLDLKMPAMGGIDFLRELKRGNSRIPSIIMSAYGDIASAVQAMKLGAVDFITKPFSDGKLKEDIDLFFSRFESPQERPLKPSIVGTSPQIQEVWKLIEKFAPTDISILLLGESGTGKELFARTIHEMSKRSTGPFVPVDCATLPESLVESELFGYEKGAFTGANSSKPGWFETAHKGTFFLDEIGNLSASVQAKLLRSLQESSISPLGSRRQKIIDVRVVSATNIDMERAVSEGEFRTDLYYRLGTMSIDIPPLREREGDISLLAQHFMSLYSERYGKNVEGISPSAMAILSSHSWPGNVREMENVMKSAVLMAREQITEEDLSSHFHRKIGGVRGNAQAGHNPGLMLGVNSGLGVKIDLKKIREQAAEEAERIILRNLLKQYSLKKSEMARQLGVDRKTLRAKMRKLGLSSETFPS